MDRNDTVAKVQETAAALADRVRDAKFDARAAELAALAREKLRDTELDARAAELAALAREKLHEGADTARGATERRLDQVGEWIGDGKVGEALGLQRKRRRSPWGLLAAGAVAAGVAAGMVIFRRREAETDDVWTSSGTDDFGGVQRSTADGVSLPLEGRVREALGQDPRTATMPPLNINVVDGTVFVRGDVKSDIDVEALRSIIEGVQGVTDVDLQVDVTA